MNGSPDRLVVRTASVGDAASIASISVRGWLAAYRGIVPDAVLDGLDVDRREQGFARLMDAGDGSRIEVAEDGGRIVGFVASGPARDEDLPPNAGEIFAIYVDPDRLRSGIGRVLLDHAEATLRAAGRSPLALWVLTANEAGRRFYDATGWRPDGTNRAIDFSGTPVDEVRYRRE